MSKNRLWVEAYRPSTVDKFIFHSDLQKQQIMKMVNEKQIPHLLFSGVQGSGKTTLSKILINELGVDEADQLLINASDENSVDTIREKIINFAQSYPMGDFKVVQLEEMDYLSQPAQAILRNVMEEYSDSCRFIGTCNYENKIMPALKSRMQHFHFKAPNIEEVSVYVAEILLTEGVHFEIDILEKYIATAYPDVRKIVNLLQQHVSAEKTLPTPETVDSGDYKFNLITMLEKGDLVGVRKLVTENASREEYEDVYRFIYDNIHRIPKCKDADLYESAIVLIASYLYKHALVADSAINFSAFIFELKQQLS